MIFKRYKGFVHYIDTVVTVKTVLFGAIANMNCESSHGYFFDIYLWLYSVYDCIWSWYVASGSSSGS